MPAPSTVAPAEMPVSKLAHSYGGEQTVVNRFVIHDEEYAVGPGSSAVIEDMFAGPTCVTSCHYVGDADHVRHCVPENRVAYHAPPNQGSIGYEHDGFKRFTAADWATPGSAATLARSAVVCAGVCLRWDIPVVFLTAADMIANPAARGITYHSQVTLAFGMSTHTDPGDHFPIDAYLAAVKAEIARLTAPPAPPAEENPVQFVVIEAPGRSPAFFTQSGVAYPMGPGGWTFINRFAAKHPDLVVFDKTWSAAEYDLVARKAV